MLRLVYRNPAGLVLALQATGTSGMEQVSNLTSPAYHPRAAHSAPWPCRSA